MIEMKQIFFSGMLFSVLTITCYVSYAAPAISSSEATEEDSTVAQRRTDTSVVNHPHYIWLNELNVQYMDTVKHPVNKMAVPAFHIVHRNSISLGRSNNRYASSGGVQQQMVRGAYYLPSLYGYAGYYSMYTAYPYSYRSCSALPPDYSYYSNKSTSSPYIILPKY